ncbi:MAG: hypothetical protein AAB676_15820 [Verrucomicrobiota bacterium]
MDLKQNTAAILRDVARGHSVILKHRGKPAAKLAPLRARTVADSTDPFYSLAEIATPKGTSLTNEEMDKLVYGA